MTENNDEYLRINHDGSAELVRTVREPKSISQALAKRFADGVVITVKNAFKVPYGEPKTLFETVDTHLIVDAKRTFCVAEIPALNLRSHWELTADQILVPKFINKDHDLHGKLMHAAALWTPPAGMRLLFINQIGSDRGVWFSNESSWLFAFNASKKAFLLPLPNVYEDGRICMGEFGGVGEDNNIQSSLMLATRQFYGAGWNADLNADEACVQRLFRFKPSADGGIEQVGPSANDPLWEKSCKSVGSTITALAGGLL